MCGQRGTYNNGILLDLAKGFHDFGHGLVVVLWQLVYELQNFLRSLVFSSVCFKVLLTRGKLSPSQVMGKIGR